MYRVEINNEQDIIDSRDIIERIEELENLDERDDEELVELTILRKLAEQCGDWEYGEQLIRDSYFEDYAQELAEDIGAIDKNTKWPVTCIDWEKAADELKYDYMRVDWDGVDYWIRY